jgi:hypothetical protein
VIQSSSADIDINQAKGSNYDMPKITVDHKCSASPTDALSKIKTFFETDKTMQSMDSKIKCEFSDSTLKGKVTGSKFKADVTVQAEGPGSKINIVIDLPLIMTPFKSKVEETLKRKLEKYLV